MRAASTEFPFSATQAAERSLRKLGIDRLDGFLVHERLPESRCQHLKAELVELKRLGLIDHYGVSGELCNVHDMSGAIGTPDIVQIAISEAATAPPARELRVFNLMQASLEYWQRSKDSCDNSRPMSDATIAVELAKMVRIFLAEHPNALALFNSSSTRRLELFVKALCI